MSSLRRQATGDREGLRRPIWRWQQQGGSQAAIRLGRLRLRLMVSNEPQLVGLQGRAVWPRKLSLDATDLRNLRQDRQCGADTLHFVCRPNRGIQHLQANSRRDCRASDRSLVPAQDSRTGRGSTGSDGICPGSTTPMLADASPATMPACFSFNCSVWYRSCVVSTSCFRIAYCAAP